MNPGSLTPKICTGVRLRFVVLSKLRCLKLCYLNVNKLKQNHKSSSSVTSVTAPVLGNCMRLPCWRAQAQRVSLICCPALFKRRPAFRFIFALALLLQGRVTGRTSNATSRFPFVLFFRLKIGFLYVSE